MYMIYMYVYIIIIIIYSGTRTCGFWDIPTFVARSNKCLLLAGFAKTLTTEVKLWTRLCRSNSYLRQLQLHLTLRSYK